MADIVEAICLVTPDGKPLWCTREDWEKEGKRIVDSWRTTNPEFDKEPYTMGVVMITMPRESYIAIGASFGPDEFRWPSLQ